MDEIFIISQILGIIGMIINVLSYQVSSPKRLILLQTAGTAIFCVHYLMLGAITAFVLNVLCVLRNVAFFYKEKSPYLKKISPVFFTLAIGMFGVLSWQNIFSLFLIIALMTNTVFLSFDNSQLLRKSILLTSSLVVVYNVFVFSLGGIVSESLIIVSSIVGIIRFYKTKPLDEKDGTSGG